MRRILLITAALASGLAATSLNADQRGIYAVPKPPRTVALPPANFGPNPIVQRTRGRAPAFPAQPGSILLSREPLFSDGPLNPGFFQGRNGLRGGFGNFGNFGAFGNLGGVGFGNGLGGQGDTNVDVTVDTQQDGGAPVVIGQPGQAEQMETLRRENWDLRRSLAPNLDALGLAASGDGPGSAELRELIGVIVARRDRQWQERISGARVVAVQDYQRELGTARREVRQLENRPRNPHILYLGFDD